MGLLELEREIQKKPVSDMLSWFITQDSSAGKIMFCFT
jgi:hypothetical protein